MANEIRDAFNTVYADGPAGSPAQPQKPRIRTEIGGVIQSQVDAVADLAASALQLAASGKVPPKEQVRVMATTNVNISNALENGDVLNGVTLATGNRVLLVGQSNAAQNGIYVVQASGAAVRSADVNSQENIIGAVTFVAEGTANPGTYWGCTNIGTIVVGTTPLTFVLVEDQSVLGARVAKAEIVTNQVEVKDDLAEFVQFKNELRRVFALIRGNGSGFFGRLFVDGDDLDDSFSILTPDRRVVLRATPAGLDLAGGVWIDANGVRITEAGQSSAGAGSLLIGDELRMVEAQEILLWPRAITKNRTDGQQYVLTAQSQPPRPNPVWMRSVRDDAIVIDADRLGSTITLIARDLGGSTYLTSTLAVSTVAIPVSGSPKILMLGDSITNRSMAAYVKELLQGWGATPTFIGTLPGNVDGLQNGPAGEGREGWSTGDYLGTDADGDVSSVLPPGGEAGYLGSSYESKRFVNVFLNSGTFDLDFYLTRFSLADPDFVVVNLGMNNILKHGSDYAGAVASIAADYLVILSAIRSALPSAKILVWFTGQPKGAGDARWDAVYTAALAEIIRIVLARRAGGDTSTHLVPVWMAQSIEAGWTLTSGAVDPDTGLAAATISDIIHPDGINRRIAAEMIAAAIATLI